MAIESTLHPSALDMFLKPRKRGKDPTLPDDLVKRSQVVRESLDEMKARPTPSPETDDQVDQKGISPDIPSDLSLDIPPPVSSGLSEALPSTLPVDLPSNPPTGLTLAQPTYRPTNQKVSQSQGLSPALPDSLSSDLSESLPHGLSTHPDKRIYYPIKDRRNPLARFSDNQLKILSHAYRQPVCCISEVAGILRISINTIRKNIAEWKRSGLIETKQIREGNFQGIEITITPPTLREALAKYSKEGLSHGLPLDISDGLSPNLPTDQSIYQPSDTIVVVSSARAQEKQQLEPMTWKNFETLCPTLLRDGYTKRNFEIVIEKWEALIGTGYKLTWDQLVESYRRAEWDAEHNESIASAVAHTFGIMCRGPYGKPKGYVDPIIQALKERVAEIEEAKKLQEQIDRAESEKWWTGLSREDRDKAVSQLVKINKAYQMLPARSQGDIRHDYWLENIKDQ